MSSTSAVAVLAQGLRELRDFAEGPDGEELRERTGLTAEQIDAALGGELLPTREVTEALVAAWDGDVEAWREYWGQISELAEDGDGHDATGGAGVKTPTPPEPSIITPIPAQDPEPDEAEAAEVEVEAGAEEPASAADEKAEATESRAAPAETTSARAEDTPPVAAKPTEQQPTSTATPGADPPVLEGVILPGSGTRPAKKSPVARVGIPLVVFAIGVAIGAFGDHALNSTQSSANSAASVPQVSQSSSPSRSVASSSRPTAGPTSSSVNPTASASPIGASASGTSTIAPGTVLGTYVGIQLASGYSVNFLSDPYHPAAGTANGPDTMGFFAGSFVDGRFYADRVAILDPTDTGSFTSCLNDTRYQHDVLLSQVAANSSFCITTDTGHLVLVTVRRMPSSTDANPYAVVDVTVWQSD